MTYMDKQIRDQDPAIKVRRPEDTGTWRISAHTQLQASNGDWSDKRCAYRGRYEGDPAAQRIAERLYYLAANERSREAVFYVAKALEQTLSEQKYERCREFLRIVTKRIDAVPFECLGGILTATLVAKQKLGAERESFFKATSVLYGQQLGAEVADRLLGRLA